MDYLVFGWICFVISVLVDFMGVFYGWLMIGGLVDMIVFIVRNWNEFLFWFFGLWVVVCGGVIIESILLDFWDFDFFM